MRKTLPLLVVIILVLTGLGASAFPYNTQWKQNDITTTLKGDVLDQSQPAMDWFGPVGRCPLVSGAPNYILAQTFKPTMPALTRVELMLAKNSTTTYDYNVAIRSALDGVDLASASIPAEQITTENFSWIEFDFPDIGVTPGDTYYIVSYTTNASDNWYAWGLKMGDVYLNGTIYYSIDDATTWLEEPGGDMTFNTYGRENAPPNAPTIDGTIKGKFGVEYSYTFAADDPDGDDVYYWISWGDGCPSVVWLGPFASGEVITVKHTFATKGTYTISAKAKDTVGVEGEMGYLEISMPRTRISLLANLFERFPHAFPILRHLMGL